MKKLIVTNSIRGFLIESFNALNSTEYINIFYQKKKSFEKVNKYKKMLHGIVTSDIFDIFGVFQIVKDKGISEEYDGLISYNRFIDTDKPYYIVMENPYGLVNYADKRMNYTLARKKIEKYFNKGNIKGIICISQACYSSLPLVYRIPASVKVYKGYPIIEDGELLKEYSGKINCLFIAADFYLKGGNEVLYSYERLKRMGYGDRVKYTIISPIENISSITQRKISNLGIEFFDYKLSKKEIKEVYNKAHIILNPTKMESFSLVTLESMKYGCIYIGTDLYAIPEMIIDGYNGFLTQSIYSPWDSNNCFIHKKHKALRKFEKDCGVDSKVADFVYEKVCYLIDNLDELKNMNKASYLRGNGDIFSKRKCCDEWLKALDN